MRPEFTLTDKDWSEINAMQAVWPDSKHQLCFWHGLRAVKQRLSKNKESPAPYNPEPVAREFSYIDKSFVPVGQRTDSETVGSLSHSYGLIKYSIQLDSRPP